MSSEGNRWSTDNPFYQNVKVVDPNNEVIFYTGKNIAKLLERYERGKFVSLEPAVLRLHQRPAEAILEMTHPIYKNPRQTRCVVCGRYGNLDRHHVIPRCVRRYFPTKYKKYAEAHDLVLTCRECHEIYETNFANNLKYNLKKECSHDEQVRLGLLRKQCYNLVYLYDKMNSYEWAALFSRVEKQLGTPVDVSRIYEYAKEEYDSRNEIISRIPEEVRSKLKYNKHGMNKYIAKKIDKERNTWNKIVQNYTPEGMIKLWRNHFIESMNPQYMPEHWNPEFTTYVGGFVRSIIANEVILDDSEELCKL